MDAVVIKDYADLLALLRARRDELGVSSTTIDEVSGLCSGYSSKLLCDPPLKRAGIFLFWPLLEALGLRCVIEIDPDAVARLAHRWHRRAENHVRYKRPAPAADAFDHPAAV